MSHVRSIINRRATVIPSDLWKADCKHFGAKRRYFPPFSPVVAQKLPSPWSESWIVSILGSPQDLVPPKQAESFLRPLSVLASSLFSLWSHYCKARKVLIGVDADEGASQQTTLCNAVTLTENVHIYYFSFTKYAPRGSKSQGTVPCNSIKFTVWAQEHLTHCGLWLMRHLVFDW